MVSMFASPNENSSSVMAITESSLHDEQFAICENMGALHNIITDLCLIAGLTKFSVIAWENFQALMAVWLKRS